MPPCAPERPAQEIDDSRGPRELESAVRAADELAARLHRAGAAHEAAVREPVPAETANESARVPRRRRVRGQRREGGLLGPHWSGSRAARSRRFNAAPTAIAKGKTKAAIAPAVFQPRSLTIMKKLAMQGRKSVIVTIATSD